MPKTTDVIRYTQAPLLCPLTAPEELPSTFESELHQSLPNLYTKLSYPAAIEELDPLDKRCLDDVVTKFQQIKDSLQQIIRNIADAQAEDAGLEAISYPPTPQKRLKKKPLSQQHTELRLPTLTQLQDSISQCSRIKAYLQFKIQRAYLNSNLNNNLSLHRCLMQAFSLYAHNNHKIIETVLSDLLTFCVEVDQKLVTLPRYITVQSATKSNPSKIHYFADDVLYHLRKNPFCHLKYQELLIEYAIILMNEDRFHHQLSHSLMTHLKQIMHISFLSTKDHEKICSTCLRLIFQFMLDSLSASVNPQHAIDSIKTQCQTMLDDPDNPHYFQSLLDLVLFLIDSHPGNRCHNEKLAWQEMMSKKFACCQLFFNEPIWTVSHAIYSLTQRINPLLEEIKTPDTPTGVKTPTQFLFDLDNKPTICRTCTIC